MTQISKILTILFGAMTCGGAAEAACSGTPIHVTGPPKTPSCTGSPSTCTVSVPVGNLALVDGNGCGASNLTSFVFQVIQSNPSTGTNTNVVVNFNLTNVTTDQATDADHMHIRFQNQSGPTFLIFLRSVCTETTTHVEIGALRL